MGKGVSDAFPHHADFPVTEVPDTGGRVNIPSIYPYISQVPTCKNSCIYSDLEFICLNFILLQPYFFNKFCLFIFVTYNILQDLQ